MSLDSELKREGDVYIWEGKVEYANWKRFHSTILAVLRPHQLKINVCFEFKADIDTKELVLKEVKSLNLNYKEK